MRDSSSSESAYLFASLIPLGRMSLSPFTPRPASRPLAVSAAGMVGVLLIHAVLVLSFVLSLSVPATRRPDTGSGASAFPSSTEPDMTLVFIEEPSAIETAAPPKPAVLASRGMAPPDLPLVVLSPDPSPATAKLKTTDSSEARDQTAAEAGEHARLYGRYLGQVQARVERAWMRPRTGIGALRFLCRVRLQQDRRGDLVGIALDQCNGTARWRESLLSAIRTASPLPAPPDASVYADVLWLSFASEGFQEEGSTQGFEPETPATRLADEQQAARQSLEDFASGHRKSAHEVDSNVVHLTIIGDPGATAQPDDTATRVPPSPPPEFQRFNRPL